MIKRGDLVQYLDKQAASRNGNRLALNKTYEVTQVVGHYVYVYLHGNETSFDSFRYFRLATKQETNSYLIDKMFNSEV